MSGHLTCGNAAQTGMLSIAWGPGGSGGSAIFDDVLRPAIASAVTANVAGSSEADAAVGTPDPA